MYVPKNMNSNVPVVCCLLFVACTLLPVCTYRMYRKVLVLHVDVVLTLQQEEAKQNKHKTRANFGRSYPANSQNENAPLFGGSCGCVCVISSI